jgi:hypothetical protein
MIAFELMEVKTFKKGETIVNMSNKSSINFMFQENYREKLLGLKGRLAEQR